MHIAIIKKRYSLRAGGSERHCVTLSRHLQALGHRVTIIGESIDAELANEVGFVPVKVDNLASWTRNRSFAVNSAQAAAAGRYDIVYGLSRSDAADVFRLTDRLQAHWLNVYYQNPVYRFLQRLNPRHRTILDLERSIYHSQHVRRIITQSFLDRRLLSQYYGVPENKLHTLHNGVDTKIFHPGVRAERDAVRAEWGIDPGAPLLVFASMDFEGKHLRSILAAMQAMQAQNARLLVLGNGPQRRFERIARGLGVERRVTFAGRQSRIQGFYGAGDLFVLPTAYEPFPNVNLEALACGLPVLTSSMSGGADIIEHGINGYIVSDGKQVGELIAAFDQHFALSPAELETMREQAWERARGMTFDNYTRRLLTVFDEVLREKFRV